MPATHLSYVVPVRLGNALLFDIAAAAPLADVRFLFGGKAQVFRIVRITGLTNNDPDILFDPTASPHEATVFFAQNPIASSVSRSFHILVDNWGSAAETLQVTAIYD